MPCRKKLEVEGNCAVHILHSCIGRRAAIHIMAHMTFPGLLLLEKSVELLVSPHRSSLLQFSDQSRLDDLKNVISERQKH